MSTLTSKDLNITRSSTRLHAPPGGKSSIHFGDVESPVKPKEDTNATSHRKCFQIYIN